MRQYFYNTDLQGQFDRIGYVIVPFLDESEIRSLRLVYENMENDLGKGFHATMHSHDTNYRRRIDRAIQDVFVPKAGTFLKDFEPLIANFTVKEPGEGSFFDLHLDWSMVDEREHRSITIWCPLEDVNAQNGHLWVLDKSPELGYTVRCSPGNLLYSFDDSALGSKKLFKKKGLSLKAGQAVIYEHRLIHGSPPNLTSKTRLAINLAMKPIEAASLHYHQIDDKTIGAFEVPRDFYNSYIIGTPLPELRKLYELEIKSKNLLQQQINQLCK